jgi:hypothetical protein
MLIENPLNESVWVFPVLEYVHIAGFLCGVGTMSLVSLRLLGAGLTTKSAAQLWSDTLPWTLLGLSLVIFSGLLLFTVNPDIYYLNDTFLLKISCLAAAILFYYTIVRRAARRGSGRIAASVSLALWLLVLICGVFIGLSATRLPPSAHPPAGVDFDNFLQRTPGK